MRFSIGGNGVEGSEALSDVAVESGIPRGKTRGTVMDNEIGHLGARGDAPGAVMDGEKYSVGWGSDVREKLDKAQRGCQGALRGLKRAAHGNGDLTAAMTDARRGMTMYIRTALDSGNMPAVKKRELNEMLASVADIGSAAELEMNMQRVDGIVTDVDTRMQMRKIDHLLGTKILAKDANGISNAKSLILKVDFL